MRRPDDAGFLRDILDAARLVDQFTQGLDLEAFEADALTSSAVMRQLEVWVRRRSG